MKIPHEDTSVHLSLSDMEVGVIHIVIRGVSTYVSRGDRVWTEHNPTYGLVLVIQMRPLSIGKKIDPIYRVTWIPELLWKEQTKKVRVIRDRDGAKPYYYVPRHY